MNIGMLWFSREPMLNRIVAAMDYYKKKYGPMPNYCVVNPIDFIDGEMPIEVVADKLILPYHLWIGMKEQNHVSLQEEKEEHKLKHGEM